jgi:predicted ribosomally synthesized peptide with nif11-like leader
MSIESAKAFFEKIKNDEDFKKSVGEIVTAEERMEFAKGAGFDFTKEEINSIKVELSDEDLDMAAGRGWFPSCHWCESEIN